MQNIERYGVVALVFLVVTVGAVLIWNHRDKDALARDGASEVAASDPSSLSSDAADPERVILRAEPSGRALRHEPEPAAGARASEEPLVGAPSTAPAVAPAATPGTSPAPETSAPAASVAPGASVPAAATGATGAPARGREAAPAATPRGDTRTYVVRASDTLSEIAQKELGSSRRWLEIVALNPGLDPARLRQGQKLALPVAGQATAAAAPAKGAPKTGGSTPKTAQAKKATSASAERTCKVASGDSLWRIAERTLGDGNRWKEIAELNPAVDPDKLLQGQVLVLPAGRASEAPKVALASAPTTKTADAQRGSRVR